MSDQAKEQIPPCASCGGRDRVAKLSRIYFDALSIIAHPEQPIPQSLSFLQRGEGQKTRLFGRSRYYREIARMAAPPSGESKVTRLLHPDAVVLGFAAISGLVLFQMLRSQPWGLVPAEGVLALALAAYLVGRRFILRRYRREREKEAKAGQRIRGAVEKWMKLYYCGNDGNVFDPESGQIYPLADLSRALLKEQPT